MNKHKVRTIEKAMAYITDCCLATVSSMAMKKSRPKGEYDRQISIAQSACDWMEQFGVDVTGTRAEDIVGKTTVAEWAKRYDVSA